MAMTLKIHTFGVNSSETRKDEENDDLDFEDRSRASTLNVVKVETFKEQIGPIVFEQLQKGEEKYLRRIERLEATIENLRATVIKAPPCPRDRTEVAKLSDLLDGAYGLKCYREEYLIGESSSNNTSRLKLHAFLSIISDYMISGEELKDKPNEYYREALKKENLDEKINSFVKAASEAGITLAKWININVNWD